MTYIAERPSSQPSDKDKKTTREIKRAGRTITVEDPKDEGNWKLDDTVITLVQRGYHFDDQHLPLAERYFGSFYVCSEPGGWNSSIRNTVMTGSFTRTKYENGKPIEMQFPDPNAKGCALSVRLPDPRSNKHPVPRPIEQEEPPEMTLSQLEAILAAKALAQQ